MPGSAPAHNRNSHFLGTKLRALRKRNGLTLEELSARCIQLDAKVAPSVSYLSMIESGKRVPSPEVLALSDRIEGTATASRAAKSLSISVRHVDGRSVTVEATDPIGSPSKPLSDVQFADKFRDCAGNAIHPLDSADVERTLASIAGLENVPDVRVLPIRLAPWPIRHV